MAENNTKKHKLSIYLIKESFTENSEILPDLGDMISYPIEDDTGHLGTLYVKTGYRTIPKWADLFRGVFRPEDISLETKSARAVLIANISNRKICLTFGHAHFLLESLSIVRNFCLRVALNIGGESSLRAVDKTSLDVVGIQSKEQSSKESSIGSFGFDFEIDILKSITAKSEDGFSTLSGRDSVSINTAVSLDTLRDLLTGHLEKYNSEDYRAKFPWVDNISPERDRGVIDSLNNVLLEKVEALDSSVWLAIPEIILWEDTSGFAYKKRRNPAVSPDIRLSVWKDEIIKDSDVVE